MTIYETELQDLKSWDEIQFTSRIHGYDFINTAGHGYLVVPMDDKNANIAKRIVSYGFIGQLAYYLEEDNEKWAFLDYVTAHNQI